MRISDSVLKFAVIAFCAIILAGVADAAPSFLPAGNLITARYAHTATLLPNGKVFITGGASTATGPNSRFISTELYDPFMGTITGAGDMTVGRRLHTATLLPNGKVLIAGGFGGGQSAELYDPATGTFTATGNMAAARSQSTATLLPNGKVLMVGETLAAELYNPDGTFSLTWLRQNCMTLSRTLSRPPG